MKQTIQFGAVGFDWTAACQANRLPWGGTKGEAQSERQRRGPRHSINVSQATANLFGPMQPRQGLSDGAAPASKIARAWGLTRPNGGASRPMPFAQALTSQQLQSNVRGREMTDDGANLLRVLRQGRPMTISDIENRAKAKSLRLGSRFMIARNLARLTRDGYVISERVAPGDKSFCYTLDSAGIASRLAQMEGRR